MTSYPRTWQPFPDSTFDIVVQVPLGEGSRVQFYLERDPVHLTHATVLLVEEDRMWRVSYGTHGLHRVTISRANIHAEARRNRVEVGWAPFSLETQVPLWEPALGGPLDPSKHHCRQVARQILRSARLGEEAIIQAFLDVPLVHGGPNPCRFEHLAAAPCMENWNCYRCQPKPLP